MVVWGGFDYHSPDTSLTFEKGISSMLDLIAIYMPHIYVSFITFWMLRLKLILFLVLIKRFNFLWKLKGC